MTATDQATFLQGLDKEIQTQLSALSSATGTAPGAGGTVITPNAFTGRDDGDQSIWAVGFEENFPSVAAKKAFLSAYAKWRAYPAGWLVTDKKGHYNPNQVEVRKLDDGTTVMVINCDPAGVDGNTPVSATVNPAVDGQGDCKSATGMRVSFRRRNVLPATFDTSKGDYHEVPLLWPTSERWPQDAEIDIDEENLDSKVAGAFDHNMGASSGGDQESFSTPLDLTQFHVFTSEWITGKSYKKFIDGAQVAPQGVANLKANGYLADDGMTIIKRVGSAEMRLELQHESINSPTFHAEAQYDWVVVEFLK